jgi:hypothetical protein
MIQAVLFDKHIWPLELTESYLKLHNFHPIKKVHETKKYYRYRLHKPSKSGRYFTKKLNNGILLIIKSQ